MTKNLLFNIILFVYKNFRIDYEYCSLVWYFKSTLHWIGSFYKEILLISNCFEFTDELDREEDTENLDEADDDGDGAYEEEVLPGQAGQLVGAASVEHIAGVVPHPALGRHRLAATVGDLRGITIKSKTQTPYNPPSPNKVSKKGLGLILHITTTTPSRCNFKMLCSDVSPKSVSSSKAPAL